MIGSGIFTVIGTAIGGNPATLADWQQSPVIDLILHHGHIAGRPGAGPALALSMILVAIVCCFTGLCYAELASMIPIAGSAYTYTYATLGELVAWIIGWDLILEYAFSNMSVAVGFAAHFVDLLDWLGIHLSPKWLSPAYLPQGPQDLAGNDIYAPGWHFGFNIPAFLIVILLTVVLVRGIRESARTNNIMVLIKLVAILAFIFVGLHFIHPTVLPSVLAQWLAGRARRRLHHLLHLHRLRFRLHRRAKSAANPQRDCADRHHRHAGRLHDSLHRRARSCLTGIVPWQTVIGDAAPVVKALKRLTLSDTAALLHWTRLVVLLGAIIGMISSILVFQLGQARVWFAMSRDRLLPDIFSPRASALPHARRSPPGSPASSSPFRRDSSTSARSPSSRTSARSLRSCWCPSACSILRRKQPERHRGFRVPGGPVFPVLSVIFCILLMAGLPARTWERFFVWLIIGLLRLLPLQPQAQRVLPGIR